MCRGFESGGLVTRRGVTGSSSPFRSDSLPLFLGPRGHREMRSGEDGEVLRLLRWDRADLDLSF